VGRCGWVREGNGREGKGREGEGREEDFFFVKKKQKTFINLVSGVFARLC
jgi:hypothetical protein